MIKVKTVFNPIQYLRMAEKEAEEVMKETESKVLSEIQQRTPKDTGAAAADWAIKPAGPKGEFDLTNGKEYVEYLNRGSSDQAPAMFIESTVLTYGTPRGVIVEYSKNELK